jgi:methyltransferase
LKCLPPPFQGKRSLNYGASAAEPLALLGRKLAVSIPDTVLEEKDSLREKTAKLGQIARACSIYGVDVVEVFRDPRGGGEAPLVRRVLEYLETPQYLRRRLFPMDESLKFAGALPPLRIPSHKAKVPVESLKAGDVREGVSNGDGTVDVGLDSPLRFKSATGPGKRVTVRIASTNPVVAEAIPRETVGGYWGYEVEVKTAAEVLADRRFSVTIATSRLGTPLGASLGALRKSLAGNDGVKLMFGAPSKGLFDLLGRDFLKKVSMVVNLFPDQQVETVRTEEAVFAGLGVVSLLCADKA